VKHTCLTNQNVNLKQFVNHFTQPDVWCLVHGTVAPRISNRAKLRTDDKCHLPLAVRSIRSVQAKNQFQDLTEKTERHEIMKCLRVKLLAVQEQ